MTTNGKHILQILLWPVLALLSLILLTASAMVALALLNPQSEGISKIIGQANAISRLSALLVIVPGIILLAILERVEGAAAIAALSAIAGYVLGSITNQ